MWQEFKPREDEIANPTDEFFGVCNLMEEDGRFRYLAVARSALRPIRRRAWRPGSSGANLCSVSCSLETIRETYDFAFRSWMPDSAYEHVMRPDFEYYGPEFDGRTGEGLCIYIPVREKVSVR